MAGANSIFAGDKLLTQKNNGENRDRALMAKLGMSFKEMRGFSAARNCET